METVALSDTEIRFAESILSKLQKNDMGPVLYARIDCMYPCPEAESDSLMLSELELIEPFLFLARGKENHAPTFARKVLDLLPPLNAHSSTKTARRDEMVDPRMKKQR